MPGAPDGAPDGEGGRRAVTQVTVTLVTLAVPTVPDGLATLQVCPVGLVLTVTL